VHKEDLDLKNHLSGIQRKLLKVSFWNTNQLNDVKREIGPILSRNKAKSKTTAAYTDLHLEAPTTRSNQIKDVLECIVDMREHDVPYHVRFLIDTDIRCGHWFTVKRKDGVTSMERRADLLQRAEPR
jgi:DNA polymerase epsilon subunit 1